MHFHFRRANVPLVLVLLCGYACAGRSISDRVLTDETGGSTSGGGTSGRGGQGGTSGQGGISGQGGFGGFGCFEKGSRVATPDGSVPIESLEIGDTVFAFDERSATVVPRRVTATFIHKVRASGRLSLADGRVLRVTAEHPIYDADRRDYVRAEQFDGNDSLVTLAETQGPQETFGSRTRATAAPALNLTQTNDAGFVTLPELTTVYNISVEGLENYFVEGVLVHNKSGGAAPFGGGTGGFGGTGGASAGCAPTPPDWAGGGCSDSSGCLNPSNPSTEYIEVNQPVGAGGIGGAPSQPAEPGGAGGEDSGGGGAPVAGATVLSNDVCAGSQLGREVFMAIDVLMPPTTSSVPKFAIHFGGTCSGVEAGEVWLSDSDVPSASTWTTQCTRLAAPSGGTSISVRALDPLLKVANLRFVSGCECPRSLKRLTSCGWEDALGRGGGSSCE
jgi:hypothetical protein